ncbi:MAG: WD40 repeat domain-containing protein, partial [Armatimonadota bacterium]
MRSFRPTSLQACFAILLFGFTITVAEAENAQRPELALQIDHGDRVLDIDYSDDGRLLASCSRDQTAKLWDARTGELIRTLRGHVTSVNAVAISPDKSRVATGAGLVKGKVCVWDIDSGQLLRTLAGPPGAAHALEWISDTRLAAGYAAGSVVLWDVSNGEKGTELTVGTPVSHLYLSAAGDVLYAVGNPDVLGDFGALLGVGGVRAWEAATWEQKWDPIEIETGISCLATTADDSIIAIGEREGPTIHLHSAETGERIRSFEGTPPEGYALEVGALAFSPDAEHLIVGYHPVPHYPMEIIQAWDIEHTKMLGSIELDDEMGLLTEMTYIPGRPEIASTMGLALPAPGAAANTWEVSAQGGRNMFSGWRDIAANGTIFPGGDRLLAGTERTGAHIWDLAEGRIDLRLERIPDGEIRGLGILPGTEKVVGSVTLTSPNNYGGNVAVWDAMTGELIHEIEGCGHDLQAVAASPAGSKIACYCLGGPGSFSDHREQGKVRVWSTEDWKLLHSFPGHTNHVLDMDFSPDGSRLITAAGAHSKHFYGGEAYLWDANTGRRLAELQRAAITGVSACAFSHNGSRVATST